ncbi:hypothetical protein DFP72DRAFT_1062679 [Ephemerocybe angulata]|uniref:Uncharacterized protein n=1 Tax=Ephemerocybe angulata TaxID=980116 RepID=A0A8H6MDC6_9AGAR|nr:hypothetical protein DFP72DRAFT_1062679 [Tulosesus angulatus]
MDKFAQQQARTSETTIAIPPALPSAASPAAPPAAPPVATPALASMAEPLLDTQLPCQLTPPSDADSTEPDSSFRPPVILFHPSSPANPLPGFILHPTFPNLEPEPRKVEPHFRTPAQQQSFQRTATIGLGDDDSDSDSGSRPARHDSEAFAPSEMFYCINEHTAEQWAPDHHRPPESPENQHQDLEGEESSGYDYGPEVGILLRYLPSRQPLGSLPIYTFCHTLGLLYCRPLVPPYVYTSLPLSLACASIVARASDRVRS